MSTTTSPLRIRPVELSSHPIQPASEPPPPLVPREWHLRLDPLLLVATIGLVACSLVALNGSTQNDVPGHPDYYINWQAIYAAIGLVLMYAASRLDYSRLRELRYPIYGLMLALIVSVLAIATATRLAEALLRHVRPDGGVLFSLDQDVANAWSAMFAHQALVLHSRAIRGESVSLRVAESLI